jgi:hypothetical protein
MDDIATFGFHGNRSGEIRFSTAIACGLFICDPDNLVFAIGEDVGHLFNSRFCVPYVLNLGQIRRAVNMETQENQLFFLL